jgi:putative endopeptidase
METCIKSLSLYNISAHGFDDQGRQYAGDGTLRDWWTQDTAEKFQQRATCLVDQYSKIEVDVGNGKKLNVNGNLTLGENIAG